VKWVLKHVDPVELRLWQAYYAVEPFGHELEYLTKLLAVHLRRGDQWEDFRPTEVCALDNRYEQIDVTEARKQVAAAFQTLARQLAGLQSSRTRSRGG